MVTIHVVDILIANSDVASVCPARQMGSIWVFHGIRSRASLMVISASGPDGQGSPKGAGVY